MPKQADCDEPRSGALQAIRQIDAILFDSYKQIGQT